MQKRAEESRQGMTVLKGIRLCFEGHHFFVCTNDAYGFSDESEPPNETNVF